LAAHGNSHRPHHPPAFPRYRRAGQRIANNLATLLSKRLIQANAKVEVLSAY
jgi:hypothetical protein